MMKPTRPRASSHIRLVPRLDREDRAALALVASYLLLFAAALACLLLLAMALGFCVHLYLWAEGGF